MALTDRMRPAERREELRSWIKTGALLVVAVVAVAALILFAWPDRDGRGTSATGTDGANLFSLGDSAGYLFTLVALLISGVYVFTTFRIDRGVKSEARLAAEKEAREYLEKPFEEWFEEFKKTQEQWITAHKSESKTAVDDWLADHKKESKAAVDNWLADHKKESKADVDEWLDAHMSKCKEDVEKWLEEQRQQSAKPSLLARLFGGRKPQNSDGPGGQ